MAIIDTTTDWSGIFEGCRTVASSDGLASQVSTLNQILTYEPIGQVGTGGWIRTDRTHVGPFIEAVGLAFIGTDGVPYLQTSDTTFGVASNGSYRMVATAFVPGSNRVAAFERVGSEAGVGEGAIAFVSASTFRRTDDCPGPRTVGSTASVATTATAVVKDAASDTKDKKHKSKSK